MKISSTKSITYNGLLASIILVLTLIPMLGYIQIGPAAIQIISIPVIIGGILFGMKSGIFLSLVFGFGSMYVAVTRGATPIDLLFTSPLVAVLPRLIFGLSIFPVYLALRRVKSDSVRVGATAFITSVIHSIATLSAIFIALGLQSGDLGLNVITSVIGAVIGINVLVESIAAVLVSIPVVKALRRILS